MNFPDFGETEINELKRTLRTLSNALARMKADLYQAEEMLRQIEAALTDVFVPPDKEADDDPGDM